MLQTIQIEAMNHSELHAAYQDTLIHLKKVPLCNENEFSQMLYLVRFIYNEILKRELQESEGE